MHVFSRRLALVNTLGTLGYLSLLCQWAWCFLILGYPFISGDHSFLFPVDAPRVAPSEQSFELGALSPIAFGVAVLVTLIVLALTAVTIARLPRAVGQGGAKLAHRAAIVIVPAIIHNKKVDKKRFIRLTYRVMNSVKLAAALLALALLVFAPTIPQLSMAIVWTIGWFCLVWTCLCFVAQIVCVRLLGVNQASVW